MGLNQLIQEKRQAILEIAARHGSYNVRLFGSVARRDADEASDVDILVELEPNRSLLDLGGFLADMQDLLAMQGRCRNRKRLEKPHPRPRAARGGADMRDDRERLREHVHRPCP